MSKMKRVKITVEFEYDEETGSPISQVEDDIGSSLSSMDIYDYDITIEN